MTKIIIGKQGDQKFPIKNAGVSRQHASITIEGGHWILEDLDSTNGTFVRDDNGLYQRVSRVEIKEDTMVRLGDESSNGYAFMATMWWRTTLRTTPMSSLGLRNGATGSRKSVSVARRRSATVGWCRY